MKKLSAMIFRTTSDHRSLLPRLIVGLIFLSEGIQKILFPELTGAGRFETIGFSNPKTVALFVATVEILCGALVIIGLATRIAVFPLFIIMVTAVFTTKIPILMEDGFWKMAHASRTDFAMALLTIFLFIYGAGKSSADYYMHRLFKQ